MWLNKKQKLSETDAINVAFLRAGMLIDWNGQPQSSRLTISLSRHLGADQTQ